MADPLDGGVTSQRLSGTVLAGARRALIGVRANIEGGRPSPVDVRISEVSCREGEQRRNKVPNPRFARGLEGWGAYGTGRVTVERLWFTTLPIEVATVTTDDEGRYRVPLRRLSPAAMT